MFTVRLNTVTYCMVKYTHTYTLYYFLPQSWWNALFLKKHIASVHFRHIFYLIFVCPFWNLPSCYGFIVVLFEDALCNCWCISCEFSPVVHFCLNRHVCLCHTHVVTCEICRNAVMDKLNRSSSDLSLNVCIKVSQNIKTLKKKWELRCLLAILKNMPAVCAIRH